MLDFTVSCEKKKINDTLKLWYGTLFSVESQNTAIINLIAHGGATGINNSVCDPILQQTPFIHHTLLPSKDNCWLEGTRIEKQPAYIRTVRSDTPVTLIYHRCSPLRHALPSSSGLILPVPIKFFLGKVKENADIISNPRKWSLFYKMKLPL